VEERTADFVMTTEQLKREIRNQKKTEQESRKAQTQIFQAQKPETFGELIAGLPMELTIRPTLLPLTKN